MTLCDNASWPLERATFDLRKQNLSIYDISAALATEDIVRSSAAIATLLDEEGFAKLPRRTDDERERLGVLDSTRPIVADHADVHALAPRRATLNLEPHSFRTQFGGLFLFMPALVELEFDQLIKRCGFPGTSLVPAQHALRSLLALKLYGTQRHLHVMSAVLDEGLALFAGLNVIPKRAFLSEYSGTSFRVAVSTLPVILSSCNTSGPLRGHGLTRCCRWVCNMATHLIWTSIRFHFTAKMHSFRSTTSQSAVAVKRGFWPF